MPETQPYNRNLDFLDTGFANLRRVSYQAPVAKPAFVPNATTGVDVTPTSILDSIFSNVRQEVQQNNPFLNNIGINQPIRTPLAQTARYDSPTYGYDPLNPNLEYQYGDRQSALTTWKNNILKFGANTVGAFVESLVAIPTAFDSLISGDASKTYNNSVNNDIADWIEQFEVDLPTYQSTANLNNPVTSWIPFANGSANNWGNLLKNLGYTAGSISGALVVDTLIGAATGGIGEAPLIAPQIMRAFGKLGKYYTAEKTAASTVLSTLQRGDKIIDAVNNTAATVKGLNKLRYGLAIGTSAFAEGSVEANQTYRNITKTLTDEYVKTHGYEPTGDALDTIHEYALGGGNADMFGNVALLSFTNSQVFGSLFKPLNVAKKSVGTAIIGDVKIGLKDGTKDVFEKSVKPSSKLSILTGFADKATRPVRTSFIEGFEEGSQFAMQRSAEDYYKRKFKDDSIDNVDNFFKSLGSGLKDTLTTREGLENIFMGILSGTVIHASRGLIERSKGINTNKDALINSTLSILNSQRLSGLFRNTYDEAVTSDSIAKDMDSAIRSGDAFEYKNLEFQQLFNFIESGIKANRYDLRIDQLNMLKDLKTEEFEKMFGIGFSENNKKTVNQYVDSVIKKAETIKSNIEKVDSIFKSPYEKNTENDLIFNEYKSQLALDLSEVQDNKRRIAQLTTEITNVAPVANVDDIINLTNDRGINLTIIALNKRYEELKDNTDNFLEDKESDFYKDQVEEKKWISKKINELGKNFVNEYKKAHRGGDFDEQYKKTVEDLINYYANGKSLKENVIVNDLDVSDIFEKAKDSFKIINNTDRALYHYQQLTSKKGFNENWANLVQEYDLQNKKFEEAKIFDDKKDVTPATKVVDDVEDIDEKGNVVKPTEVIVPTVTATTTSNQSEIEAKKADIERRRQEELSKQESRYKNDLVKDAKDRAAAKAKGHSVESGYYANSKEGIDNNNEGVKKIINAKYDAELAALEQSTKKTTTTTSNIPTPKPSVDITPNTQVNAKDKVADLANDNYLFTHVTTEANAKSIVENGFNVSPGTGISSTLTQLGKDSVNTQIDRLQKGEIVHRDASNNSLVVIAVPKSLLDSIKGQSLAEKFENWLAENNKINEKGQYSIPKEFNAGYLSGNSLITESKSVDSKIAALNLVDAETPVSILPFEQEDDIQDGVDEAKQKEKGSNNNSIKFITDPTHLYNQLFSQNYEDSKNHNNLREAVFTKTPSEVYDSLTLSVEESTVGMKKGVYKSLKWFNKATGRYETFDGIYYTGYGVDMQLKSDEKIIGLLQPAERLSFKRGPKHTPLYEITPEEYVKITKNEPSTYTDFINQIKEYKAITDKIQSEFKSGKTEYTNNELKNIVDIVIKYGGIKYAQEERATVIGKLNYKGKGSAILSFPMIYNKDNKTFERSTEAQILNKADLSKEEKDDVIDYLKDNIENIHSKLNSRYVYLVKMPDGKFNSTSAIAARPIQASDAAMEGILDKLKNVAKELDKTSAAKFNADIKEQVYIADSRNRKGLKTRMYLSVDEEANLYLNVYNEIQKYRKRIKITEAKEARNFKEMVDMINQKLARVALQDTSLDRLNIGLDRKDFKNNVLQDDVATTEAIENSLSIAATPNIFEDFQMNIFPFGKIAISKPTPKAAEPVAKADPYALTADQQSIFNVIISNIKDIKGEYRQGIEALKGDPKFHSQLVSEVVSQYINNWEVARSTFGENISDEIVKYVPKAAKAESENIKTFQTTQDKKGLSEIFKSLFGLPVRQAQAVAELYDRTGEAWASRNKSTKEEFYKKLIFEQSTEEALTKDQLAGADIKFEGEEFEQEKQNIKKETKKNGTYLKAPNGKPTLLTEDQWLTVRTSAFKNWFGQSKVVDQNGEPQVMYHGTSSTPIDFERKSREGFRRKFIFVAPSEDFAKDYTTIKAYSDGYGVLDLFVKTEKSFDYENEKDMKLLKESLEGSYLSLKNNEFDNNWHIIESPLFQTFLKEKGFDSFYTKEGGKKNLAVYTINQLKDATGKNTTFLDENPSILFQHMGTDKALDLLKESSKELNQANTVGDIYKIWDKIANRENGPIGDLGVSYGRRKDMQKGIKSTIMPQDIRGLIKDYFSSFINKMNEVEEIVDIPSKFGKESQPSDKNSATKGLGEYSVHDIYNPITEYIIVKRGQELTPRIYANLGNNGIEKLAIFKDDFSLNTPVSKDDVFNMMADIGNVIRDFSSSENLLFQKTNLSNSAMIANVVKGFELQKTKGFGLAFTTKNKSATPVLATKINKWLADNGYGNQLKFVYENTYGTVNPFVKDENLLFQKPINEVDITPTLSSNDSTLEPIDAEDLTSMSEGGYDLAWKYARESARGTSSLLNQGAKGAIKFIQDGQAIIYALTSPDVSTPVHELAHFWEKQLTESEKKTVLNWTEQTDWNRDTSESFAVGFEKYLSEGNAPTAGLQKIFDNFKKWLKVVYKVIIGSSIDVQLNEPMKKIYATMLGEQYQEILAEETEEVQQEQNEVPKLTTVVVDLSKLTIDELKNVAKQLRQKAVDARDAEKQGKTVLGGSAFIESDYQAVKKYISELESKQEESIPTSLIGPHEYRGNNKQEAANHYVKLMESGLKPAAWIPKGDIQEASLDKAVKEKGWVSSEKFVNGFGDGKLYAVTQKDLNTLNSALVDIDTIGETKNNAAKLGEALGYNQEQIEAWYEYNNDNFVKEPVKVEPSVKNNKSIIEYAAGLEKMTEAERDNVEFNENNAGYEYYVAKKIMPKKANSVKFKKVTEDDAPLYDYDYIANIEGVPYGLSKDEDPDNPDEEKAFVYNYVRMDNPEIKGESYISDNKELVDYLVNIHNTKVEETKPTPLEERIEEAVQADTFTKEDEGTNVIYQGKEVTVNEVSTTGSGRTMLLISDGSKYGEKYVTPDQVQKIKKEITFDEGLLKDINLNQEERFDAKNDGSFSNESDEDNLLIDYVGLKMLLENLKQKTNIPYQVVSSDENWSGRFNNGVAVININKVSRDTPFHEYLHPFISVLKVDNQELYRALVSEAVGLPEFKEIFNEIKNSEYYKDRTKEEQGDEALVRLISKASAKNVNKEGKVINNKFSEAYQRIMQKFSEWFHKVLEGWGWIPSKEKVDKYGKGKGIFTEGKMGKDTSKAGTTTVKNLPIDMTIQDIADLYSVNSLAIDFKDHMDLISKLDEFQADTEQQTEEGKIIARIRKRLAVLDDTARVRTPSDILQSEVIAIRSILKNTDEIEGLNNYIHKGLQALDFANDEFTRLSTTLKNPEGKLTQKQIGELNQSLSLVKNMLAFYDDVKILFNRIVEDLEPREYKSYSKTLLQAEKNAEFIKSRSVDLTVEWLYPYVEEFNDKIKNRYPEYVLTKEQFKNKIYSGDQDSNFLFYWLGSISSSSDPVAAVTRKALFDVMENNHIFEAELGEEIKITYAKFLKSTGLENEIKQTEEYYKKNYLRKATVLEKTEEKDEAGKPIYKYKDKWAFHEEFLFDQYVKDKDTFLESLGERPEVGDPEYQTWVNKIFEWEKTNGSLSKPSEKYRNNEFVKLYGKDELFTKLYDTYKEATSKLGDSENLKFGVVPQVSKGKSAFSDIKNKEGIPAKAGTILGKIVNFIIPRVENESTTADYAKNLDDSNYRSITTPYIRSIEESDINLVLPETIFKFAGGANLTALKKEVEPNIVTLKNVIEGNSKFIKEARKINKVTSDSKTIFDRVLKLPANKEDRVKRLNKQLTTWIDATMYGLEEDQEAVKVFGRNIDLNKVGGNLSFLTALNNMAFNVTAGIGNVTIGNIMSFGESLGGKYYSAQDWRKAASQYFSNTSTFMKDAFDLKKSKITQLGIKYDAIQGEFRDKYGKNFVGNVMQRYATSDTIFFINHAAEHQIQLIGMLALMNATKVKVNTGAEISLLDAHVINEKGFLRLRKDIEWTEADERLFTSKLHGINKVLNGNYSKFDKAQLQRSWFGKLLLIYRKFMYNAFKSRWGKRRPDYEIGDVMEGYYRKFFTKLGSDIKEYKFEAAKKLFTKEGWNEDEKYAWNKTVFELGLFLGTALLTIGLSAADDDDNDNSWAQNYLSLQMLRLRSDLGMYSVFGVTDVMRVIQNPSAVVLTLKRYSDILAQIAKNPFETYDKKTGGFEKGESVLQAKILKALPIIRQFITLMQPEEQAKFYKLLNKY